MAGVLTREARTCTVAGTVPPQTEKDTVPSAPDVTVVGAPQKVMPSLVLVKPAET